MITLPSLSVIWLLINQSIDYVQCLRGLALRALDHTQLASRSARGSFAHICFGNASPSRLARDMPRKQSARTDRERERVANLSMDSDLTAQLSLR